MHWFLLNSLLGLAGFCLAFYIAHKKRHKTKAFICPLRGNCAAVVHSDYACFCGVPVEFLGMFYYAMIAVGYAYRLTHADVTGFMTYFLFGLSFVAVCFSFYLTLVQIRVLRKFCTWCLVSAFLTLCIFVISIHSLFPALFS